LLPPHFGFEQARTASKALREVRATEVKQTFSLRNDRPPMNPAPLAWAGMKKALAFRQVVFISLIMRREIMSLLCIARQIASVGGQTAKKLKKLITTDHR
jgi:hypothetical protein